MSLQRQQRELQKSNRFNNQNNNFARASSFLYISLYTSDDRISSLFLNLDMVLRNSTLEGFTYI